MPIDNRLEILDFRLTLQMNQAILEFFRWEIDSTNESGGLTESIQDTSPRVHSFGDSGPVK